MIDLYFPPGSAGYDQQFGVTVLSRARPLYEPQGVRLGGFVFDSTLDAALIDNSSVNGTRGSASWGAATSGAVSAASDWTRHGIGASAGFTDTRFFRRPGEDYTDWNAGLTGRYDLGDAGQVSAAYAHSSYHQLATSLGAVRTTEPIADATDTALLGYSIDLAGLTLAPELTASRYQFGTAVIGGTPVEQGDLDRDVLGVGVTARYAMNDTDGLVLVARGIDEQYPHKPAGQKSNDSNTILLLAGLDRQASGVWRYRLLAGVEERRFTAWPTHAGPLLEGSVIWTPTGLTTLTGTLTRAIEDPDSAGFSGEALTTAQLVLDHEYDRNILFDLRGGGQYAQYLQGGTQSRLTFGASVTVLLNRNMRVSFDYDFSSQTSGSPATASATPTTGAYAQSLAAITLHFAL